MFAVVTFPFPLLFFFPLVFSFKLASKSSVVPQYMRVVICVVIVQPQMLLLNLVLKYLDFILTVFRELKDHYAGTEPPVEQQQNIPELLKAILHRNPNVFKGPPGWLLICYFLYFYLLTLMRCVT